MIDTILEVQPSIGIGAEGKSSSDVAFELADMIMGRIDLKIDPNDCHPKHLKVKDF